MGAEPVEPPQPALVEPTPAAVPAAGDAPIERPAPEAFNAPEPTDGEPKAGKSKKLRAPEDIIRHTLEAQAAAWNEGDLDAFMGGYWKDQNLRFVSGTEVTRGWSRTLKRYRARYGEGAEMGELAFDKVDVKMVTDDVAVVVGRFALARAGVEDSGVFSLVMKRMRDRWRIVHDHTVGDVKEELASTE